VNDRLGPIALLMLAALQPCCAKAQALEAPPPLVAYVQAPGGYPRVPAEAYLSEVQSLSLDQVRALHAAARMDATVQLARLLWFDGDTVRPIELLAGPAEKGVPVAQYLLGTYLRFRNRDVQGAVRWLTEAARQGHPTAQETLAGFHESGTLGVAVDAEAAFRLYLAAGRQGLRHAQMNVGMRLCKGSGVPEDKTIGKAWFINSQQGQLAPLPPRAAGCE
jgi:Sel1 repeat